FMRSMATMTMMAFVSASFKLHWQVDIAYIQQSLINITIDSGRARTWIIWHNPVKFTNEFINASGIKFGFKASA
ncbi:hypothetical protein QP392_10205, partial [Bifidobacterium breve]|nr:hypothetical protein [Bifidobacterium breve]